jgi:hypothetical protein
MAFKSLKSFVKFIISIINEVTVKSIVKNSFEDYIIPAAIFIFFIRKYLQFVKLIYILISIKVYIKVYYKIY